MSRRRAQLGRIFLQQVTGEVYTILWLSASSERGREIVLSPSRSDTQRSVRKRSTRRLSTTDSFAGRTVGRSQKRGKRSQDRREKPYDRRKRGAVLNDSSPGSVYRDQRGSIRRQIYSQLLSVACTTAFRLVLPLRPVGVSTGGPCELRTSL